MEKALARLKELAAELEALMAKDAPTAEDVAALQAKTKEFKDQEATIAALKDAEDARSRAAKPADAPTHTQTDRDTVAPTVIQHALEPAQKLSLVAAATLKAYTTKQPALKVLSDSGYDALAKELGNEMRRKAINTDTIDVTIPESITGQFIPYLRPEVTFFQGGPRQITFVNGKFKAPRGLTGTTASYVGEGQKKPTTDVTFDTMEMSPKKLAAIVLITDEARDWSVINIDAYIRDDLRRTMAQTIDTSAYWGTGAGLSPVGITKYPGVPRFEATAFGAGAATNPSQTQIDQIASRMFLSLVQANLPMSSTWRWLMSYRTLEFLRNVRGGDEATPYAYPEIRAANPTWKGIPILLSTVVPENLGDNVDATEIALIDFRYVLYGEDGGLVVKTSDQATVDVNGTLVLLWQQNMYGILTEHRHDFGLVYDNAVAVVDGIRWGTGLLDVGVGSPSAS